MVSEHCESEINVLSHLPIKSHSPFGIKLLMSPPGSFRIRSSCKKSFNFRCVALLFSNWLSLHVRQQKLLHLELGCNSCQSHRYTLFISVHITFDKTTRTIEGWIQLNTYIHGKIHFGYLHTHMVQWNLSLVTTFCTVVIFYHLSFNLCYKVIQTNIALYLLMKGFSSFNCLLL